MGRPPCVGDSHSCRETFRSELVGDLGEHLLLASLQVVGAFGVQDKAVDPVDGDDWRVDGQRPEADTLEG
jgi:hypothetical protein